MKTVSVNKQLILDIVKTIRLLNKLSIIERRSVVDQLMKLVDVTTIDNERLICARCASKLRGYACRTSVYRMINLNPQIHAYRVCCRDFFDRRELEREPKRESGWQQPGLNKLK